MDWERRIGGFPLRLQKRKGVIFVTKVDIFSGFLGAGKTTLIKKLIKEAYQSEKLVLIENEFGEIGIDGGFMQEAGIEVTEMNSGCICCSLVGDFGKALSQVLETYQPDRILIEPSGVGKLSDVIAAVQEVCLDGLKLNAAVTVVDANKCRLYMKNFGEFFNNQIAYAGAIILSRTDHMEEEKLLNSVSMLRAHNGAAPIITTAWEELGGKQILEAMESRNTLQEELHHLEELEAGHAEHPHTHHENACHDHAHEYHHSHESCACGHEHEHKHEHGEHCSCGCEHGHHHGHDAEEVFTSWGVETPKKFTMEEVHEALRALEDERTYGLVLRAKGMVPAIDGGWIHFDYVPGESNVRSGGAGIIGRLCVIGAGIYQDALSKLFAL